LHISPLNLVRKCGGKGKECLMETSLTGTVLARFCKI
jgi:hypothetical protein